ncbi:imidazole glycerol phosphate synthase subunit HisH [Proteus mirabilis]|uniref:imidazole glycerol phosphate synthase subunit HisH n=1 Tax=Proteus mirabilis TaxID=584 RepID=UPI000EFA2854|nr:imidazole glycerol phosphate synthase subunit HisH [Proteus mirabilis]EMB6138190.1 imidazole glycerol phosphate synthase subunit HisH [Proteus mirabilis]MBN4014106.1 imidazole glycerol phosphate synthase subunit HisH [Proteus mirabilis]MBN4027830.1 imidazole glycerol phosphate synthase subunit HisH [Proteus mirabilis]QSC11705.1 imidazole glycerol phosphate synthase subunit HisH [Proteus mirabilis]QSC15525.1 imidazole glycerol phosphate synthase subunit HisH [Proteus mirabilis]
MKVVILDTGCANLASVTYAVQRLGYDPIISYEKNIVLSADKLFLPGVGTASAAMEQLKARELIPLIKALTQPVLGICLGMQILASLSEEGHNIPLLGLVDGNINKLDTKGLPLPHMGWDQVLAKPAHPLFRNIDSDAWFYFVHSYGLGLNDSTIAETEYGSRFSSAIQKDNFYGVQFHPERSGKAGAQLIKNFLEM